MRIDRRLLNWGVFLIVAGAIPLAIAQGLIARESISGWWRLWPLILVGLGIGLIMRRTPGAFLGGLVVAVTLGVMVGGLIGVGGSVGFCSEQGTAFSPQQGTFGAQSASVSLELNCGEAIVTTTAGSGWSVSGSSGSGRPPTIQSNQASLRVSSPNIGGIGFGESRRERWQVSLPRDVSLALALTVNAGSGRANLSGARLDGADFTLNAGDLTADLGSATLQRIGITVNAGGAKLSLPKATLTGSFTVNAGSLKFCIPSGVGLRLTANDTFAASYNYGSQGLTKTGNAWQSADYEAAEMKVNLDTNANAGSIELNPKDGCT